MGDSPAVNRPPEHTRCTTMTKNKTKTQNTASPSRTQPVTGTSKVPSKMNTLSRGATEPDGTKSLRVTGTGQAMPLPVLVQPPQVVLQGSSLTRSSSTRLKRETNAITSL